MLGAKPWGSTIVAGAIRARLAARLARRLELSHNPAVPTNRLPASAPLLELGRLCRAGIEDRQSQTSLPSDSIQALARRHRVEGLVAAATGDRAGQEKVIAASLRQAAEVARVRQALAELDPLFLKGLAVAAQGYVRPLLKQSADIDVLVAPHHLDEAYRRLEALGYALVLPRDASRLGRWNGYSNQSVWRSPSQTVELHHRATLVPFAAAEAAMEVEIAPGINVPTYAPRDQYAYLALHGALSGWFRLKWLVDYAALALRCDLPITTFHSHAQSVGAGRASAQALLLAEAILGLEIPHDLSSTLRDDQVAMRMARLALRLLEGGEPTESRFGTLPIHASFALLRPAIAPIRRRVRDILAQRLLG